MDLFSTIYICPSRSIIGPGKAVQLPDQNYVEDFLSAVLDHPLKVWAVIRFGRVGTVNVGAVLKV